jgi:hypothetical protein
MADPKQSGFCINKKNDVLTTRTGHAIPFKEDGGRKGTPS